MAGARFTNKYINQFARIGISDEQVNERLEEIFQEMFYGDEDTRIYHPVEPDMGYMEDTGNHDARTEGMSYGMMMCVQTNHKEEFDRIWKWAQTYMYMEEGPNAGYFSWSNAVDGTKNAYGPAPDGEEYFVMALFFASRRWGDGQGIYNYSQQAKAILHTMINKEHHHEYDGREMFAPENHYIRFITEVDFTDPSYHLPHFYELCAEYADGADAEFMKVAATESRKFLHNAICEDTGLSAEYSFYDGKPYTENTDAWGGRHDWFYSDAYRTILNVTLDNLWYDADDWQKTIANTHLDFFVDKIKNGGWDNIMLVDGTQLDSKVLHPIGLLATIAATCGICDSDNATYMLDKFWNTPLRNGNRRYYDNCLYFFSFMLLSGNYRIY